jgi:hypothetical protein
MRILARDVSHEDLLCHKIEALHAIVHGRCVLAGLGRPLFELLPTVTKPMMAIAQCLMDRKASTVTCENALVRLTCPNRANAR